MKKIWNIKFGVCFWLILITHTHTHKEKHRKKCHFWINGLDLVALTSDWDNASGLLPTVWDSSRKMIRRHAIAIFIRKTIFIRNAIFILPCFGNPRGIIWMGTWKTLHLRRILCVPGAISVHGGFSPGKPRTRAIRSRDQDTTDWITAAPFV